MLGLHILVGGSPLFPRTTEWDISGNEGEQLLLNLDLADWVYIEGSFPCEKQSLRVRGTVRGRLNAYFYVAIAIEPNNASGCPYIFGPSSAVFSLKPQNDVQGSRGSGEFSKWCWYIDG